MLQREKRRARTRKILAAWMARKRAAKLRSTKKVTVVKKLVRKQQRTEKGCSQEKTSKGLEKEN